MIEIKENPEPEAIYRYQLFLNNELLLNTRVSGVKNRNDVRNYYQIYSKSVDDTLKLFKNRIDEFPPLEYLDLSINATGNDFLYHILISPESLKDELGKSDIVEYSSNKEINFRIATIVDPLLEEWTNEYTFKDYIFELEKILLERKIFNSQTYSGEPNDHRVVLERVANFGDEWIEIEIQNFLNEFNLIHLEIIDRVNKIGSQHKINNYFDFPENLKVSCEQYLVYFAQFLQDLGINATSNLKEEAGKVLFSVTPTDDVEALDKIREALAIYLKLPESPIIYDDSFASMRLQQQIENLQHSQRMAVRELQFNEKLLVAQSDTIHEKNITISQQQSVIENQNKIIEKISSAAVMMNSAVNKEELEEIYDGVKVGESESLKKWLGISLNPAKVIKTAVKNTLGKDSKKSVLGLDEDI